MGTTGILLDTINDVKEFVDIVTHYGDLEAELVSGRYSVDAKSIMGIFSLDLSQPLQLNIHVLGAEDLTRFMQEIEKFKV